MSANNGEDLCLVTGCIKTPRSRGLCDVHYTYTASLVKKGEFTWSDLVKAGACLERKTGPRHSGNLRAWFKEKGIE